MPATDIDDAVAATRQLAAALELAGVEDFTIAGAFLATATRLYQRNLPQHFVDKLLESAKEAN